MCVSTKEGLDIWFLFVLLSSWSCQSLDVKTEFGFPSSWQAVKSMHGVTGYVRNQAIRRCDRDGGGSCDAGSSISLFRWLHNLSPFEKASRRSSVDQSRIHDKITLTGFCRNNTNEFCTFESVRDVQANLEKYLPPLLPKLSGRTDFQAGVEQALNIVEELKTKGSKANIGNESFRWDDHNHTVFMTDGKDYGNVPWEQCERIGTQRCNAAYHRSEF